MTDYHQEEVTYFDTPADLLDAIGKIIIPTEIVLDIGPGIYPSNFFVPKFQILIEPWIEYVKVLQKRYESQKDVMIFHSDGLTLLKRMSDQSVDSSFLLDVVEHLDKMEGLELIKELKRVSRQQIVVFTPLGFMPQHIEKDNKDRWGMHGGEFQEHKSGWEPSDFREGWKSYVCKKFHELDARDKKLNEPFGAFFAVFDQTILNQSVGNLYEGTFFKETPKDAEISRLSEALRKMQVINNEKDRDIARMNNEKDEVISQLKAENISIYRSTSWKLTKPLRYIKEIFSFFG